MCAIRAALHTVSLFAFSQSIRNMADVLSSVVTAQTIAGLKRENTQLHRTLADVNHENNSLKRQLFHTSAVLDIALSKLSSLGIALDPPVDLRALRSEVKAMIPWTDATAGGSGMNAIDQSKAAIMDGQNEASATQRKFRLQAEIKDHTRSVQCAAFGPEDQQPWIASGGLDKRVVVSNFLTGVKHAVMEYHEQNVSDVVWLSNATILSASFDCTIKTCDLAAGQFKTPLYSAQTRAFALAACSVNDWVGATSVFAACDSKQWLYLGDTRVSTSRSLPVQWQCSSRANTIAYDPSLKCLVTGHINGTVSLWDVRKLRSALTTTSTAANSGDSTMPFPTNVPPATDVNSAGEMSVSLEATMSGPKSPSRVADAMTPVTSISSPSAPPASSFEWTNEPSKSPITHVSFHGDRDAAKKLLVVSEDNMARLYGRQGTGIGIDSNTSGGHDYQLEGVLNGFQTRSYSVRGAYWCGTGQREKRTGSGGASIFDDEREADSRHVSECDLVVCGGGEDCGLVFDVTDSSTGGNPTLLQRLDGHRGRVWGACMHRNAARPIIATWGEDSCVRVWVPRK
jgi:WD40 repeat protein